MSDLKTYLSVAPVVSTLWLGFLAGILIEINRLFPDALIFSPFSNYWRRKGMGAENYRSNQISPINSPFFF